MALIVVPDFVIVDMSDASNHMAILSKTGGGIVL
jgi:hypothetical protein